MQIHPFDIAVIIASLLLIVFAGLALARRSARSIDAYFLGERTIPWYLLGVSSAAGMFDLTATIWLITMLFVYGMKSVWLPWLWPSFSQVFFMVYLAVWLRRSNVLTGAEWIRTRFGPGLGAELAHLSVVLFALVSAVAFLACAFQAVGTCSAAMLPWSWSPNTCAVILISVAAAYIVFSGMYGVVLTDIIQFAVLTIAALVIAGVALVKTSSETIAAAVPYGWYELFFGWRLDLDWSELIASVNSTVAADGFSLFGLLFMMMLFRGTFVSVAGPAPNHVMQRILATRTPRQSALMSWFVSVVLFFPRYLLVGGIAVLALAFFTPELTSMSSEVDYERILPYVITNFVPAGLVGLVIAGLLAAFMSTFDSTVNAAAAYLVNDIYKRYIAPDAPRKKYIRASYICSLAIIALGVAFGLAGRSLTDVFQWLIVGLIGGYVAPNILKWYWWRLNGFGYFAGMVGGIALALILPAVIGGATPLNVFPVILLLSAAASIGVSLFTAPEDEETLKQFYTTVRPWGFWSPIHRKVLRDNALFRANRGFLRDMFNVALGIVWQTTFPVLALALVTRLYLLFTIALVILIAASLILKVTWFDKLERT